MKLKELLRVLVAAEMEDIAVYSAEAELFGSGHVNGDNIRELFERLAAEKRVSLLMLGRVGKQGTGFRQRKTETARAIEAALRAHITRAERCVALYCDLVKLIKKPEFKEEIKEAITRGREHWAALKELQALIKVRISGAAAH